MAVDQIYLTVSREKYEKGYLAVLSYGQPQLGDEDCKVLDCTWVQNMKEAKAWKKQMINEKPWETRQ